jgi:hypothetical protein
MCVRRRCAALQDAGVWDRLWRGPWQHIVYMAQGAQRQLGPRGSVLPITSPTPQLMVRASWRSVLRLVRRMWGGIKGLRAHIRWHT